MKSREHRKHELLSEVLIDALVDERERSDRFFAAKAATAGRHAEERKLRQELEAELLRLRSTAAKAAATICDVLRGPQGGPNDRIWELVAELEEVSHASE